MSEDFEILYSDSKESGSHHSHHHSDGEHHSSHHHSDESHHSSHHHGSHRHSKQRKRRKRILIITLSIVACLLIAIGVGGAYGYKIAKREVADVKQHLTKKYGRQLTKSLNSKDILILSKNFLISFRKLPQILHVQQLLYLMTIRFQDLKLMMASA